MVNVYTVSEVAQLLKTSKENVRKMIRAGVIPAGKIGREYRVSAEYLQAFLEETLL